MVHQFSGSETRPPSSSSKCASLSLSDLVLRNALASSGPKSFFFDGYGNMVIVIPPTPRVPELSIRLIDKKPRKRPLLTIRLIPDVSDARPAPALSPALVASTPLTHHQPAQAPSATPASQPLSLSTPQIPFPEAALETLVDRDAKPSAPTMCAAPPPSPALVAPAPITLAQAHGATPAPHTLSLPLHPPVAFTESTQGLVHCDANPEPIEHTSERQQQQQQQQQEDPAGIVSLVPRRSARLQGVQHKARQLPRKSDRPQQQQQQQQQHQQEPSTPLRPRSSAPCRSNKRDRAQRKEQQRQESLLLRFRTVYDIFREQQQQQQHRPRSNSW